MNASLFSRPDGHYVKLYLGEEVYDTAGPFDERDDAELAAYRMTAPHGHVGSYDAIAYHEMEAE